MIKRRQLLKRGAIAATTGTILLACDEAPPPLRDRANNSPDVETGNLPRIKWRMVTSWPKSLDTIYGGAQTICDRISAMTGGNFTIEPYAAEEIVPAL